MNNPINFLKKALYCFDEGKDGCVLVYSKDGKLSLCSTNKYTAAIMTVPCESAPPLYSFVSFAKAKAVKTVDALIQLAQNKSDSTEKYPIESLLDAKVVASASLTKSNLKLIYKQTRPLIEQLLPNKVVLSLRIEPEMIVIAHKSEQGFFCDTQGRAAIKFFDASLRRALDNISGNALDVRIALGKAMMMWIVSEPQSGFAEHHFITQAVPKR